MLPSQRGKRTRRSVAPDCNGNYVALLAEMGRRSAQILIRLNELAHRFGISFARKLQANLFCLGHKVAYQPAT